MCGEWRVDAGRQWLEKRGVAGGTRSHEPFSVFDVVFRHGARRTYCQYCTTHVNAATV